MTSGSMDFQALPCLSGRQGIFLFLFFGNAKKEKKLTIKSKRLLLKKNIMIKLITSALLIFFCSYILSQELNIKNYEYAKIYYFNTDYPINYRPANFLYKDGIYAESKIGNGQLVSKGFIDDLNTIFAKGIDELYTGLSKTFIPKTGLIFYDSLDNPMASLSISTDCEGLRWWPEDELSANRTKKPNIKKAEKQIAALRHLLAREVMIFDHQEDYKNYVDTAQLFISKSEINIDTSLIDPLLNEKVYESDIKSWLLNYSKMEKDTVEKITHGGDLYFFKQLHTNNFKSTFLFSEVDDAAYLVDAKITDSFIKLPNGIQVGMSLSLFYKKIGMLEDFEMEDAPKTINITDGVYRYTFTFKNLTLKKIKIW